MDDLYISKQKIFDERKKVFANELFFKDSLKKELVFQTL